jgi:hypothetical protein
MLLLCYVLCCLVVSVLCFHCCCACVVSKALVLAAIATAATLSTHLSAAVKETEFGSKVQENKSERVEAAKDVAVATIGAAGTTHNTYIYIQSHTRHTIPSTTPQRQLNRT